MQTAGRWRRCRQCARMVQYIGCDVAWLGAVLSGGGAIASFNTKLLCRIVHSMTWLLHLSTAGLPFPAIDSVDKTMAQTSYFL